jgi:transcription-repair coupling factor (superfamily II helicase)
VGRGPHRAYAYLLYPAESDLAPDARDRLEAIAQSSDLGSGFRLAMRDLEIRGAGDILGARQHGQVAAIGLDLYTRLLAAAINKLQADSPALPEQASRELAEIDPGTLPTVDLPLDAYLPGSYVGETNDRTRLYRRMAVIDTTEAADDLARELADRFGPHPPEVRNLMQVLRLRILAHLSGARSIGDEGGWAVVRWPDGRHLDRSRLKAKLEVGARIGQQQASLPIDGPPARWLPRLVRALEAMVEVEGAPGGGVTAERPSP